MEKRIFYITLTLSAILFLGTGIYDNFLQTLLWLSDKPLPGTREYNESLNKYVLDPPDVTLADDYDSAYAPAPQVYYPREQLPQLYSLKKEERQREIIRDFLTLIEQDIYRKNLREPLIVLDPNPRHKLIHLATEEGVDTTYQKSHRVSYPRLQIDGMNAVEVWNKFKKDDRYLININVDTLRYGVSLHKTYESDIISYMVSKIHYAEVHYYHWTGPSWSLHIYFLREGNTLKAFWGWERNGTPLI